MFADFLTSSELFMEKIAERTRRFRERKFATRKIMIRALGSPKSKPKILSFRSASAAGGHLGHLRANVCMIKIVPKKITQAISETPLACVPSFCVVSLYQLPCRKYVLQCKLTWSMPTTGLQGSSLESTDLGANDSEWRRILPTSSIHYILLRFLTSEMLFSPQ